MAMRGSIRAKELVLLWTRAAGMCSHPDCKTRLVLEASGKDEIAKIGQAAHIVAAMPGGPRGDAEAARREVNRYENLILLCPTHHAMVDKQPATHTVDRLMTWKAEHEAWVEVLTEPARRDVPWTAVVHQEFQRMDVEEAKSAVGAGNCVAAVVELRTSPERTGWAEAAQIERNLVEDMLARTPAERRRFAVYSFGRIPLAVQLGYVLGDRSRVRLFHYDRDRGSWQWPDGERTGGRLREPAATNPGTGKGAASIRVSLSARVRAEDVAEVAETELDIEIAADEPSVRWLRRPEQLTELAEAYGRALDSIRAHGGCRTVHLFYAGPAAGAVAFGRAYNRSMNAKLVLHEYQEGRRPAYERVLRLEA